MHTTRRSWFNAMTRAVFKSGDDKAMPVPTNSFVGSGTNNARHHCRDSTATQMTFENKRNQNMLVLSRKSNQTICIGNDIVVHVIRIKGSIVRLGIDAPEDVRIRRSEIPNWRMASKAEIDDPGFGSTLEQPPSATL